ncbi:MAG: histidinol dehydrogenase, partial [Halobacteriales archaeon]
MEAAITFADDYAAEHLSIQAAEADRIAASIANAGSVFLGPYTPVAAGDYASGTNHILPTNGRARVVGGLSVDTFMRSTTIQRLDRAALESIGEAITTLARAEGLDAHAASVERRLAEDD